jgi:hypothetical protein
MRGSSSSAVIGLVFDILQRRIMADPSTREQGQAADKT